jgi:hypothetical protein
LEVTSPKKVGVVTGRAGFLGSNLAAALWVPITELPAVAAGLLEDPSHSQGLFYQVGGDSKSVGFNDRFLQFTCIIRGKWNWLVSCLADLKGGLRLTDLTK